MTAIGRKAFGLATLVGDQSSLLLSSRVVDEHIVARGSLERLGAFVDLPPLRTALDVIEAWDGLERTARAWSPAGGPAYEIYPSKSQIRTLYDAGSTIVLESIERFVPALRPLCRQLERDLRVDPGCVNVEVFCARRGGHGRPHFDPSFTFNCQVAGRKTWRLERNPAVQHPTFGMFLGRTPTGSPPCHDTSSLPTALSHAETVVAEPGTVVFLPPGVLHETIAASETYAIAFAIENVDSVARRVMRAASDRLFAEPRLRAARFGPQFEDNAAEARAAAAVLRELAAQIEEGAWPTERRYALRDGLKVEALAQTRVMLSALRSAKILNLDPAGAALLIYASDHRSFTLADALCTLPAEDAERVQQCLQQFANAGILEADEP